MYFMHEIHPADEIDWTIDSDWEKELEKRNTRNTMVRDALAVGRAVQFRSSGNSLWPVVKSGDVTMGAGAG